MLTKYIQLAMHLATYELLDDETFYGEIPGFQGVYATDQSLETCREQLQEVLEGWIILGLRLQHQLPVLEGIDLTPTARGGIMQPFGSIKRTELIRAFKKLGFSGPFSGGNHQYMVKGQLKVAIPNPHKKDISKSLLARILRQANVAKKEWDSL